MIIPVQQHKNNKHSGVCTAIYKIKSFATKPLGSVHKNKLVYGKLWVNKTFYFKIQN